MTPEEAVKILGLPSSTTAAERKLARKIQRARLELKLVKAPTPEFQASCRESLRRLEEAYATLERPLEPSPPTAVQPTSPTPAVAHALRSWPAGAIALLLLVGLAGCFFAGRMNRAKPPQWSTAVNGPAALSAAPNPAGATPAAGKSPYPTLAGPFRNSLGMKFVPVAGTSVLFGIWDVRVRDFEAFVNVSGYPATNTMQSLLGTDGTFLFFCDTWRNPDFVQGPTHPVCGVSWDDARAFCDWLTQKERREGRLNQLENYRLPTSAEWSIAAGNTRYPWGGHWPPPPGAGNFAGMDAAVGDWPTNFPTLPGYRDGYPRTSPVGSFPPNQNGLYDMGGNVMQWCMDWYHNESKPAELKKGRVSRGSSWFYGNWEYALRSASYLINPPSRRLDYVGFRCVLCNVPR